MRILAPLALLGIGLTLGAPVCTGACFCLVDQDRTPYYDCVEGYRGPARTAYVECRPQAGAGRVEVRGGTAMRRVSAGKSPCGTCEVQVRTRGDHIRGDDDTATAAQGTGQE